MAEPRCPPSRCATSSRRRSGPCRGSCTRTRCRRTSTGARRRATSCTARRRVGGQRGGDPELRRGVRLPGAEDQVPRLLHGGGELQEGAADAGVPDAVALARRRHQNADRGSGKAHFRGEGVGFF
ncbi:hypothetical protein PAHAL_6G269900 [Panicum hallii]|uniref:Uncharacterized protein n=1 Tax=Panicum hallii TaxID=206008 RepID=A0A2T8IHQ1_9POAL|nr:hypothetical protein PAHAL_6G269900 [Panicum hallii]